jgi:hypothetical protein
VIARIEGGPGYQFSEVWAEQSSAHKQIGWVRGWRNGFRVWRNGLGAGEMG